MMTKYIAFWGWTNSTPKNTPEEAMASVPPKNRYTVKKYPADVSLDHYYSLPTRKPLTDFELKGVK